MDLTSLAAALLIALGLLGADAVMTADNLVVEVVAPPRSEKISIDEVTLEQTFESQLRAISDTKSLVQLPEIRASRKQGIGMALAEAARVQGVAYALQTEMGYSPDRLRLALYVQNGALQGLITGNGHNSGPFEQVLIPRDDESLPNFVRRAALTGVSQLAPYTTALYLLQARSHDKDFGPVLALAAQAKAKLPPNPVNRQRSLLENIPGIVALFNNDAKAAKAAFAVALAADPTNPVAVLNMGFAEVEIDDYKGAAERMERFITSAPPANKVLLATAYMTWAAAEMGLHNPARADELLAKALEIYPTSATGLDLWAEAKEQEGDHAAAAELRLRALAATVDTFENYAEVAALYFHLSWENNVPVMRNKFANPPPVMFH
jgi:tetratricopeptide (TPR) repeat protein